MLVAIKREDVVGVVEDRFNRLNGRHSSYGNHWLAEFAIKAIEAAGYDIVKWDRPAVADARCTCPSYKIDKQCPIHNVRTAHSYVDGNGDPRIRVTENPRWAEPDDIPAPSSPYPGDWADETKTPGYIYNNPPEPPVEEPIPACTYPRKKKFANLNEAREGARAIEAHHGERYEPLYPYECPSGGHWHLSHYRQGEAVCPVCQIKRPAWRGGESYWVISRHNIVGNAGACNGTGDRVYDKGQTS